MRCTVDQARVLHILNVQKGLLRSVLARHMDKTVPEVDAVCKPLCGEVFNFINRKHEKNDIVYSLTDDGLYYSRRIVIADDIFIPAKYMQVLKILASKGGKLTIEELALEFSQGKKSTALTACKKMFLDGYIDREQRFDVNRIRYYYFPTEKGRKTLEENVEHGHIQVPTYLPKVASVFDLALGL